MSLFDLSKFDETSHFWPLWNQPLRASLQQINSYGLNDVRFLDVAGGAGWVSKFVSDEVDYHLIDYDADCIARSGVQQAEVGNCEEMPYEDATFDVLFSVSAAQYMNHTRYLQECFRVLKPGGLLALHENGAHNPIVRAMRFWRQRVLTRTSARWRDYNDTIQGYLEPHEVEALNAEWLYTQSHHLLSASAGVLYAMGRPRIADPIARVFEPIDRRLLKRRRLGHLGFMNVYHLKKVSSLQ